MFALTVDQVDSRHADDRVEAALGQVATIIGDRAILAPERTAGDEFQLLLNDADLALDVILDLTRRGEWSVGLGVGAVDEPLPTSTRAARGEAFLSARDAVERAKTVPEHVAVEVAEDRRLRSSDVDPLVAQAVRTRARRSDEGWELADLLRAGHSRVDAARILGITPQAVAKRFGAAELRSDDAVRAALVRLLTEADQPA
ncbi:DNA-binding protein [Curtobacterium flaccumfaciens]|uniref:DNA-binding protein n=1 Tax=Curtobacterium flaccumfaciens TaxID=2035 RepID=UPI001BDF0A2B|nr:DNA-binding protein [Curtobacterium flaccumfaciens]MBT1683436.1 DNA-binding protein [Curtobacterium flaccumfaciens pv. flaccumfaciens]